MDLRGLADEELMELVADGEARGVRGRLRPPRRRGLSLAYRICGRRAPAEDIVQEAFLSLWRSGARYDRARGSVRTWVLGVVHNRAIDALRRSGATGRDVARRGHRGAAAGARADRRRGRAPRGGPSRSASALDELPADQRQVIELAYFGGFTHSEIASMLDRRSAP